MFVGGAKLSHFATVMIMGIAGIYVVLQNVDPSDYRVKRYLTLDPWADPLGDGFQVIQSLYSLGSGVYLGWAWGRVDRNIYFYPMQKRTLYFQS